MDLRRTLRRARGLVAAERHLADAPADGGPSVAGPERARSIAVVMDGNRRWARERGLPVIAGHRAGARALKEVAQHALDVGVANLTVFSWSTENWRRPATEVDGFMSLYIEKIDEEVPELHAKGARVRFIGRRDEVGGALAERIEWAEALTAHNERMTFCVAFNYGGRAELVDAAREAVRLGLGDLDEERFASLLTTAGMPDPDLVIRTSGEQRISNLLLWQVAYAELFFSPKLWPDFGAADLDAALADYASRQRRLGA